MVAKSQSVQIKFDEETDYQLRGGMIFLKDNKTKRRTLNNLPVIIDDQIQAEAKHKNLSVNDLYINIIKETVGDATNNDNLEQEGKKDKASGKACLLYTSPSPRDKRQSRMPSSA